MIPLLAAMHAHAARRGEGLRPELLNLFESSTPALAVDRAELGGHLTPPERSGRILKSTARSGKRYAAQDDTSGSAAANNRVEKEERP
jgi:hypothetical protein